MTSGLITSRQIDGETVETWETIFGGPSKIPSDSDCSHEIKTLAPWKKSYDKLRQHIKKQRCDLANKAPFIQNYSFSSGHVWIWEWDYKQSWVLKKWWFWTVVWRRILESLGLLGDQTSQIKGNHPQIFIGRANTEAEALILRPPDMKSQLIGKDSDAGKDWTQEENEMTGWNGWMASPTQWIWVWASFRR